jgi:hypothetical protein
MDELRKGAHVEAMKGAGTKAGEEKKVVARTRVSIPLPLLDHQSGRADL